MTRLFIILVFLAAPLGAAVTFVGSTTAPIVTRGLNSSDVDFSLGSIETQTIITAGTAAPRTVQDAIYSDQTSATYDRNFQISVTAFVPPGIFRPTFASTDPTNASIDTNGAITKLTTNGATVSFTVSTPLLTKRISLPVVRVPSGMTTSLSGFVAGSLANASATSVDSAIAGKTSSSATVNIFSGASHNPSNAFAAFDWTGICYLHTDANGVNQIFNATPISPSFIITNKHETPSPGHQFTYLAADGTQVTRTATAWSWLSNTTNCNALTGLDLTIGKLDSPLPGTIKCYKILPTNLTSLLPSIDNGTNNISNALYRIPLVYANQFRELHVSECVSIHGGTEYDFLPSGSTRAGFFRQVISFDSGSPEFFLVNGEPVLVATRASIGTGQAANIAATINGAIGEMSGSDTATISNVAAFNSY
jgi:hypothetical protein